jgi:hypothetical protein
MADSIQSILASLKTKFDATYTINIDDTPREFKCYIKNKRESCIEFSINKQTWDVHIDLLKNCNKGNGTQHLKNIYEFARENNYISMSLVDVSELVFIFIGKPGQEVKLDLRKLSILKTGHGWYQNVEFGRFSNKDMKEYTSQLVPIINSITLQQLADRNEKLSKILTSIDIALDLSLTISAFFTHYQQIIKSQCRKLTKQELDSGVRLEATSLCPEESFSYLSKFSRIIDTVYDDVLTLIHPTDLESEFKQRLGKKSKRHRLKISKTKRVSKQDKNGIKKLKSPLY